MPASRPAYETVQVNPPSNPLNISYEPDTSANARPVQKVEVIDPPRKPETSDTSVKITGAVFSGAGCLVILLIGLGLLWALIAIIKWMWMNS
jgi:hypothetical protein